MALSRTQQFKRSGGPIEEFEIAASTKIYAGGQCALNAAGYVIRATDTDGSIWLGIATETKDNSSGSAGDLKVLVDIGGAEVLVTHTTGSLAIANVGDAVYADGDDAVDAIGGVANPMLAGRIVRVESATTCWVHCRPFAAGGLTGGEPTALVTLTDSSGLSGSHDDTVAAVTNGTAVVLSNMDDGSADNTLIALTGTYDATEAGKVEQNFDKLGDEINTLITAVGVLSQNQSDLAQKVIEIVTILEAIGAAT
jgi:hypothetical protein